MGVPLIDTSGSTCTSTIVPTALLAVVCPVALAVKVMVSLNSSRVSAVVGTRTMMPSVLLAGTVTLKGTAAVTLTVLKVRPPSTLTSTAVPVSVPKVALTLASVKLTVVAVAEGALKSTVNARVLPSLTVSPLTVAVGAATSVSVMVVVTLA